MYINDPDKLKELADVRMIKPAEIAKKNEEEAIVGEEPSDQVNLNLKNMITLITNLIQLADGSNLVFLIKKRSNLVIFCSD